MDNQKGTTDLGTLIGFLAGISIIVIGVVQSGGKLFWFFNFNSLLIVVGGTFAATMVNLPLKAVGNLFNILKNVFKGEDYNYVGTINEIVEKAQKARKNGLLSLEKELPNMREGFFKNGIELAINERESSRLRTFLNLEMNNIQNRHIAGQELFLYMGSYAPAFGMFGTVDPSSGMRSGSIGAFLGEMINYLIIAFVMFLAIKAYNHFEDMVVDEEEGETASDSKEVVLLKEIRDGINNLNSN